MKNVMIYTDGATSDNGKEINYGGWGAVILEASNDEEAKDGYKMLSSMSGSEPNTTNQRMEMTAVISALENIDLNTSEVTVRTDSAYIVNCKLQKWYVNWEKNGWKNAKKQPVANKDLWEKILPYFKDARVKIEKVSGHAGVYWNEVCDTLAVEARQELAKSL